MEVARLVFVIPESSKAFLLIKGEIAATNCSKPLKSKMEREQDGQMRERWGKNPVV